MALMNDDSDFYESPTMMDRSLGFGLPVNAQGSPDIHSLSADGRTTRQHLQPHDQSENTQRKWLLQQQRRDQYQQHKQKQLAGLVASGAPGHMYSTIDPIPNTTATTHSGSFSVPPHFSTSTHHVLWQRPADASAPPPATSRAFIEGMRTIAESPDILADRLESGTNRVVGFTPFVEAQATSLRRESINQGVMSECRQQALRAGHTVLYANSEDGKAMLERDRRELLVFSGRRVLLR